MSLCLQSHRWITVHHSQVKLLVHVWVKMIHTIYFVIKDTSIQLEVESLKILGFHFDSKLTWNTMISQLSTRCRQRMGALYREREYSTWVLGALLLLSGLLSDLYVSTAVLHLWVLQLPIYQSLIRCRS